MNLFSPQETYCNFVQTGIKKTQLSAIKMFILGILAGAFIAFACVLTNTAAFGFSANASAVRLICGLLFPLGLCMVICMGTELFTGNTLIAMALLDRKITAGAMLKNWVIVYLGNFVGSILVAWLCCQGGQFNNGGGDLAVFTIKLATSKATLGFYKSFILGILCNFLVCVAVLFAASAKDVTGKVLGAYIPVCAFVMAGFEHSVANMYYIPAGLFAAQNSAYAAAAAEAGLDLANLTWANFFTGNLIPVTLGNIVGGSLCVGAAFWFCYVRKSRAQSVEAPKA